MRLPMKREISNETYIELITIATELKDVAIVKQNDYIRKRNADSEEIAEAKKDLAEGYLAGLALAVKIIEKHIKGAVAEE